MTQGFTHGPGAVFTGKVLNARDWGERAGYEIRTAAYDDTKVADIDLTAMPHIWKSVGQEQLGRHHQGFSLIKASPAWVVMRDLSGNGTEDKTPFLFSRTRDLMRYDRLLMTLMNGQGPILQVFPDIGAGAFDLRPDCDVVEVEEPHFYVQGSDNLGHWIFDNLPLLLATKLFFPEIARLPLVLGKMLPDHPDYLALFGFAANPILMLNRGDNPNVIYRFKTLYVATLPPALDAVEMLQKAVEKLSPGTPHEGSKRLYLSRDHFAPRHRVANETEMQSFLKQRGFEICRPHLLGPAETIRLMQQAELVVLPHGAGLGNLPLANPNAQIIILAPSFLVDNRFEGEVLRVLRHYLLPLHERVRFVPGEPPPGQPSAISPDGKQVSFNVTTFDQALVYDLRQIDICLMQAEADLVRRQRA